MPVLGSRIHFRVPEQLCNFTENRQPERRLLHTVIGVIKRIKGKTCPESKEDALARVRYGFRADLLFCCYALLLSTEIRINGGSCRLLIQPAAGFAKRVGESDVIGF